MRPRLQHATEWAFCCVLAVNRFDSTGLRAWKGKPAVSAVLHFTLSRPAKCSGPSHSRGCSQDCRTTQQRRVLGDGVPGDRTHQGNRTARPSRLAQKHPRTLRAELSALLAGVNVELLSAIGPLVRLASRRWHTLFHVQLGDKRPLRLIGGLPLET